jgi:hypothetical protein
MKIPNVLGLGFRVFGRNGEQQEANRITNMTYATPYQIAYEGLLVETDKLSSAYDADATPTQCVAVPAAAGEYVDGWTYISTYSPHPLPGGANVLYPLTANIGNSGYAEDYANWADVTVAPLIPGQLIGVPVYAGQNMTQAAEVAAATGGLAKVAESGQWVVGKVEWNANNTAGTSGAKTVSVRICHQYKKA